MELSRMLLLKKLPPNLTVKMSQTRLVPSSSMPVSLAHPSIVYPKRLGQATDWGQSTHTPAVVPPPLFIRIDLLMVYIIPSPVPV